MHRANSRILRLLLLAALVSAGLGLSCGAADALLPGNPAATQNGGPAKTPATRPKLDWNEARAQERAAEIAGKQVQPIRTFDGPKAGLWMLAFSPDEKLLAGAGADKAVYVWDVQTGKQLNCLEGHSAPVLSVAFSKDGKKILSVGKEEKTILWDVASGAIDQVLDTGHPSCYGKFLPDGTVLVVGHETWSIWNLTTASMKVSMPLQEHVWAFDLSPDGKMFVVAMHFGIVQVWNIATRRPIAQKVRTIFHEKLTTPTGVQRMDLPNRPDQLSFIGNGAVLIQDMVGTTLWNVSGNKTETVVRGGGGSDMITGAWPQKQLFYRADSTFRQEAPQLLLIDAGPGHRTAKMFVQPMMHIMQVSSSGKWVATSGGMGYEDDRFEPLKPTSITLYAGSDMLKRFTTEAKPPAEILAPRDRPTDEDTTNPWLNR